MREAGVTILELIVVMAIAALLTGVAVMNLRDLANPRQTGAAEMVGFLKKVRGKAMNATKAYTVMPVSAYQVVTKLSKNCKSNQKTAGEFTYKLPAGVSFGDTNWSICYSTRGMSDTSVDIPVTDRKGRTDVQVVLGGGARIKK